MLRALLLCALLASTTAAAPAEPELTSFLRSYTTKHMGGAGTLPVYTIARTDLDGDGKREAIVYVSGPDWCGSGGCNLWILTPHAGAWQMVTSTTITRPPIRILETRSHGWRDISVFVAGGGILPGHEAVLRFDGSSYPANPSMVGAVSGRRPRGQTIISRRDKGRSL